MKKILTLLAGILFYHLSNAQTAMPTDAYAYFVTSGANTNGYFNIELASSADVNSIKVRLGSTQNEFDLIDHVFEFDITSGLPSGFTFSRNGNSCILGIGLLDKPDTIFGEVSIEDSNGHWSDPYQFISN